MNNNYNYNKEKKSNSKLIWVLFILSFIFLFVSIKYSLSKLPNTNSITEIKGLLKDFKIKRGRRGGNFLTIKLNEYPEINFIIGSVSMSQIYYQEFVTENKLGDSISLFIEKHQYNRKILKSEKIPFPEKYLHKNNISIVELHSKNTEYLTLNDYIKVNQNNNYLAIAFFGFLGLLMLLVGIKHLKYYNTKFR